MNNFSYELKYYLYAFLKNLRFTRIINAIFITNYLKFSLLQFAFFQSIYLFSQIVSDLPLGIISDIFGKKKSVILGLYALMISSLLMASVLFIPPKDVYYFLLLAFLTEGIGTSFLNGADDALFFENMRNEKDKSKKYSLIRGNMQLICSITVGVATFFGGVTYSIGVIIPYMLQALAIFIASIFIFKVPEVNKNNKILFAKKLGDTVRVFAEMCRSLRILFMFFFTTIIVAYVNVIFAFLPNYFTKIGFSSSKSGLLFMLYSLIGGAVATQSHRISKIKISKIVLIIILILSISIVLQIISVINICFFIVSLGILYIVVDIIDPIIMEMLHLWVKDEARATIISGLSLAISVVTMMFNPIIGYLQNISGAKSMVLIASIVILVLIVISYLLILNTKSNLE